MKVLWWSSLPSPCVLEAPDGPPAYCGGLMPAITAWERINHLIHRKKSGCSRVLFLVFRGVIRQTGITRLYRPDGSETAYSPLRILALGEKEMEFERTGLNR